MSPKQIPTLLANETFVQYSGANVDSRSRWNQPGGRGGTGLKPVMYRQPRVMLSARDVAERLGVSLRTVWRWNRAGELPAPVRRGRIVRWKAADIDRFVAALPVARSGD